MPEVNFYLKKPDEGSTLSLVYLQMRYHGQKFVYSCKFSVESGDWDKNKQVVKTRTKTVKEGKVHCNTRLKDLRDVCLKAYNTESAHGIPDNKELKRHLDAYMFKSSNDKKKKQGAPTLYGLIDELVKGEIGGKKAPGTVRTYSTAKMHLKAFEKLKGYSVDFDTVTLDFKYKYSKYLTEGRTIEGKKIKPLSHNSLAKEIKTIRTFMNLAVELGYTKNLDFKKKKFGQKSVEVDNVALTDAEVRKLYEFDFSNDKRLETVRDLFIFSCFTGLRYSDATNIKPENIVKNDGGVYVRIISKKTQQLLMIPCDDIVMEIFEKYKDSKNRLPENVISNQKYNDYLKELAKIAGLNELGRKADALDWPLFKCMKSHTARRTFATKWYLAGMDTLMLRGVTGHTTEASFLKYIKVSKEENAKRMAAIMKLHQSNRMLKAV